MPTLATPIAQRETAKKAAAAKAKDNATQKATENADIKSDHKAKAKAIAAEKKAAAKQPKPQRDRSRWNDATGHVIEKGVTVKADGKPVGTAAYFHTHEIEGKKVGMVGVALSGKGDLLKVGGRTVKNRTFRADALTVVPE